MHCGPVTIIEMYNNRAWTGGGAADKHIMIEWTMRGQLRAEVNVGEAGKQSCALPAHKQASVMCQAAA